MPIDISKEEVYKHIQTGVDHALKEFRREYLPSRILTEMIDSWPEPEVELFLASYPETPSILLERIAYMSKVPDVLCAIASHPRTSAKIMQDLASHDDEPVRQMLAVNKQISPQTAALLSEDDSVIVKMLLAANPSLPSRVRNHLLTDPSALVRSIFVDGKNIDSDSLSKLLMDPDFLVKAKTAIKSKVTDELVLKWADSDELLVQLFLMARKNLPPKALESLSFSTHPEVQKLALRNKVLAEDEQLGWATSDEVSLKIEIAGKEELTEKVQQILAEDSSLEVRRSLAANSVLCDSVRLKLAQANQGLSDILLEQSLNADALTALCLSSNEETSYKLALEADLNDQQVAILANKGDVELIYILARRKLQTTGLQRERVVDLVNSRIPTLIAFCIQSECLKVNELSKFIAHPCSSVKLALLGNPNINRAQVEELTRNEDAQVAQAAVEKLSELPIEKNVKVEASTPQNQGSVVPTTPAKQVEEDVPVTKKILKKIIKKVKGDD
ncbi:MAG: DUF2336 domain-containing protein [Lentisphaerales bacterium]|nr:DUF2336 domain-containing protein [Lentisphaerales bacterium]